MNVTPTQGRAGYGQIRNNPKLTGSTGLSVAAVGGVGDQAFELSGLHTDAIYLTEGDTLIFVGFSTPTSPPLGRRARRGQDRRREVLNTVHPYQYISADIMTSNRVRALATAALVAAVVRAFMAARRLPEVTVGADAGCCRRRT